MPRTRDPEIDRRDRDLRVVIWARILHSTVALGDPNSLQTLCTIDPAFANPEFDIG